MTEKRTLPPTSEPEASIAPLKSAPTDATTSTDETSSDAHIVRPVLFPLGRIVATPGAIEFMERNGISPRVLLELHQTGDWGDVCAEDAQENVLSVKQGFRVLSAYRYGPAQEAIWVITEADRSSTTILLPEDY